MDKVAEDENSTGPSLVTRDYIIKEHKANVNEVCPAQLPRATYKITPRIAILLFVALRKLDQIIREFSNLITCSCYTPTNVITTINYSLVNSTHPFSVLG